MTATGSRRNPPVSQLFSALGLLGLMVVSSGCSQIRDDVGQPLVVDEEQVAVAADYHQVLRLLGPPHAVAAGKSGMVFLYEEIDLIEQQVGINLSKGNIALFKAVAARGMAERKLLLVSFDHRGQTQAVDYRERSDAEASGAALQFVFAVAGVVEDEDLRQVPAAHEWGFGLLEADLPVALNRQQNLTTGKAGVQQQGTPTAVGQHTLELRVR